MQKSATITTATNLLKSNLKATSKQRQNDINVAAATTAAETTT
jgi:hypothetical protein